MMTEQRDGERHFINPRVATKMLKAKLPACLQVKIWEIIDEMPVMRDNLQNFSLEVINRQGGFVQRIFHTQELPLYEKEIVADNISVRDAVHRLRVVAVDDGIMSVLMCEDEYEIFMR